MEKIIEAIIEGGKATTGPPLGPALGPLGVNAAQVVAKINEATQDFSGIKVPVKVRINKESKTFTVEVGSPPTAELIKKELGIQKGASSKESAAGDIAIDKLVKVARAKKNSLGKSLRETLKEVLGSCVSMGITVSGRNAKEILKEVDSGKHDSLFAG
jgi:large subunit ribosomal protein L11